MVGKSKQWVKIWEISLLCAGLCCYSGCNPSILATTTPEKSQFVVDNKMPFDFYYPSNWILLKKSYDVLPTILFVDPNKSTPVSDLESYDSRGMIMIIQLEVASDISLDKYATELLQDYGYPDEITLHSQKQLYLDGIPAIQLVFSINRPIIEGYVTELILLHVNNYIYEISFSGLEEERDNDFGQAYDEIIRTMKIIR